MSHAVKHPSPDQRVADALKQEVLRAMNIHDHGNDMRGSFYDFDVDLEVRGKNARELSVYGTQFHGIPENEKIFAREEEDHVAGAASRFREDVLFNDTFDPDYFKVSELVDLLNAYFEKEGAPLITNPDLIQTKEKH